MLKILFSNSLLSTHILIHKSWDMFERKKKKICSIKAHGVNRLKLYKIDFRIKIFLDT